VPFIALGLSVLNNRNGVKWKIVMCFKTPIETNSFEADFDEATGNRRRRSRKTAQFGKK
jgi:hypothetical protein